MVPWQVRGKSHVPGTGHAIVANGHLRMVLQSDRRKQEVGVMTGGHTVQPTIQSDRWLHGVL
jgi:hypothetical protein